jgi:hypothetical protein
MNFTNNISSYNPSLRTLLAAPDLKQIHLHSSEPIWKKLADRQVPFTTPGRKTLYGEKGFEKLQKLKAVECVLNVLSVSTPLIAGICALSSISDLGDWALHAGVAIAADPNGPLGSSVVDLTYLKHPHATSSRWSKGKDFCKFSKIERQDIINFIAGVAAVITIFPILFQGCKLAVRYYSRKSISCEIDQKIANLRNEILAEQATEEEFVRIRNNADAFKKLYHIAITDTMDALFNKHLLGTKEIEKIDSNKVTDVFNIRKKELHNDQEVKDLESKKEIALKTGERINEIRIRNATQQADYKALRLMLVQERLIAKFEETYGYGSDFFDMKLLGKIMDLEAKIKMR